ncbi:MAG: phytoene desaturase family protein [Prochloraceae cyanobacterium]
MSLDAIVIGSGIGGLTAGAMLARYGKKVLICESHSLAGGAVHSFTRRGFHFDSGASFYCGLGKDRPSLHPLKQVLDVLEESLDVVAYDPLGHYHFPEVTIPIYSNLDRYRQEISKITPTGAKELERFEQRLLQLYAGLKDIPTISLRSDWQLFPYLISNHLPALIKMFPQLGLVSSSVGKIMDEEISDRTVRRLIDLECFLLSGLKADGTIAPEVAFMLGERTRAGVEYPLGGGAAIVAALVRGLQRWGGELRLNAHVDRILLESGKVKGIQLAKGEVINAPVVISNATIWDTYTKLLSPTDLPASFRTEAIATPAVDSFMHLHLGIRSDGLENLTGHHVVVHNSSKDITVPGNTCMISIPSVWDKNLAPAGRYVVHAYTLEPFSGWKKDDGYQDKKLARSQSLFKAVRKIIPDLDSRIELQLIGSPLTHSFYLRRDRGTYGPAIPAGQGMFPSCHTPIQGLYRVGDSTMPGIGVPAVAGSGILCANTLVSPTQTRNLLSKYAIA